MRALYEGRLSKGLNTADAVREASLTVLRERCARTRAPIPSTGLVHRRWRWRDTLSTLLTSVDSLGACTSGKPARHGSMEWLRKRTMMSAAAALLELRLPISDGLAPPRQRARPFG